MADDLNPGLRKDLLAALDVLSPQLRGLHDLSGVSISPDLRAAVTDQINDRERRVNLIHAVLDIMDSALTALRNLEQDGYPDLPSETVPQSLFGELQEEAADLRAAVAVFIANTAANVSVNLGKPADKKSPA